MNDEQKKGYLEKYKLAKEKGVKFWPDIIYKDVIISLGVFILLIGLASFIGVVKEPPADPNDSAYIPRPEWYFLFLFEMLKFFPGKIEWIGTFILPVVAILALLLLPFYDRSPFRYWKKRVFALTFMGIAMLGVIGLTIRAVITTPKQEESVVASTVSEGIILGQDLYSIHCTECHGADGEGGEIKGVEGLEGTIMKPINSPDEMYTRTDDTLYNIIDYGQQDLGMTPFGLGNGGELKRGDIEAIVTFMRYTWDDRVEIPEDAAAASAIALPAADQVPSYDEFVAPIFKRYCISCHRPGRDNHNYLMGSYEEVLTSGDNAPVMVAGDANSLILRLINGEEITDLEIRPMPPNKPIKPEYIDVITRWIMAGMPQTVEDAANKAVQP
jgi:mono/diheme cytochrome c family protein